MSHKLTVTIPSYKQPKELTRVLTALSVQTFKDFAVIIIDDKSGMNLDPVIAPFKDSLSIQVIYNNKNLGAMRNIEHSILYPVDTPYIFSHHEDDYIKNNYLELAVQILEENEKVSFVISPSEWVAKDAPYKNEALTNKRHTSYDKVAFVEEALRLKPFIFGSIVYRRRDLVSSYFDLDTFHTLCDRVFLVDILAKSNGVASYIHEPAIYVRDHTLDEEDARSHGAILDNLVAFLVYYKEAIPKTKTNRKLITNASILGYANFPGEKSWGVFYEKQKKPNLIHFSDCSLVSLYALIAILIKQKHLYFLTKHKAVRNLITS